MKIELTEEQAHTILISLLNEIDNDMNRLVDNPKSEYYLNELVNARKTKDYIIKCMLNGGN